MKVRIALFILSVAAMAAFGLFTKASAQSCVTTYDGTSAYTNCYDYGGGLGAGIGRIADQMQRQAFINSYREAHGLPKCSAFPIFHWDGLPAC